MAGGPFLNLHGFMHACMHTPQVSENAITPKEVMKILPHAKNQPNQTTRSDFMNNYLYTSDIHVKQLIIKKHNKITSSGPIWLIFCMWQYFHDFLGGYGIFGDLRSVHACIHEHMPPAIFFILPFCVVVQKIGLLLNKINYKIK